MTLPKASPLSGLPECDALGLWLPEALLEGDPLPDEDPEGVPVGEGVGSGQVMRRSTWLPASPITTPPLGSTVTPAGAEKVATAMPLNTPETPFW